MSEQHDPSRTVGCQSPSARQAVRSGVTNCDHCGAKITRRVRVNNMNLCCGCVSDKVLLRRLMNEGGQRG